MTFGDRLKSAREKLGLSQTELGRNLGTDGKDANKQVVLGWEKGRHFPRADQLVLICDRLKCTADYLLFGADAVAMSYEAAKIAKEFDALPEDDRAHVSAMWDGMVQLAKRRRTEGDEKVPGQSHG